MTSIENFTYLKKLFYKWKSCENESLKELQIAMINKHLDENKEIIGLLVSIIGSTGAMAILDDIKYHKNHFEKAMKDLFPYLRKTAVINCLANEFDVIKKSTNQENKIIHIIEKYELQFFDANIKSSSHDTEEFIHDCESILIKIV
ncbi:hypothetical protein [Maribacter sp. MAR_2009_72]|uniref:hypothetical protein n=1 Tax=Maribacter sp. MAR_2009_72 TaxID=1250050 RepID=UPI001198DB34|nr:hypothetical protein [Maribacter sp. MAR_2009_72]TVZ13943.1 hypothetical protein JM81_0139 [Maribacter sp. MAR_2009_72]